MSPRCPVCRKAVVARRDDPAFPMCSPRCKQIDLGRWLGESYRIPAEPTGEDGADGARQEEK